MRWNETGCDPNHKRLTADRDRKTLRYIDPQTTATGRDATIGEPESGTNQAARRS